MKYGLFGFAIPMLCEKVLMPYVQSKVPGFEKKKIMTEYKAMIARNPNIGTMKTNPLLAGLYLAAYALAFHKAYPEYIDGEALGEMTDILAASEIMKKLYAGKDFFAEKNISSRAAMAKEPADLYPDNWKYDFHVDLENRECFINYHACAICNMCKREGCFELLKHMCKIDYVSQELMGNTLIRTKTLAEGHDVCDFHIIGK